MPCPREALYIRANGSNMALHWSQISLLVVLAFGLLLLILRISTSCCDHYSQERRKAARNKQSFKPGDRERTLEFGNRDIEMGDWRESVQSKQDSFGGSNEAYGISIPPPVYRSTMN